MTMADEPEIIEIPTRSSPSLPAEPVDIDPELLAKAEALVAGLRPQYLSWVREDLDRLQATWESARATEIVQRAEAMRAAFAVAHDIKGQGGSFGYPLMTDIGAQLCRFLEAGGRFDDEALEVVRLHIEAMRLVVADRMEGDGGDAGRKLMRGLQAVIVKTAGK